MALQLPGIVVDIRGDSAQLKKDITVARQYVTEQATGMSNSINNALSGQQIKGSINTLVGNLSQLSQASQVTGNAFKGLGVNLGDLQKVTGTTVGQFQKLQEQILKTQTAAQQEKALRGIAVAAGLSAKEITTLGKQFGLTKSQIESVIGATTKASTSFSALASSAKLAIASLGVGAALGAGRGLIMIADQYSLIDSKLKLVSKSTEEFGATYKELFAISQRTWSSFQTNAGAFSSLSLNLRDMNVSTSDTLKMFEMLNKSLMVNGSNTQEAASFMLQFKQAMGSGKLAGDELKAMLEANSYFGTLLAKSLGVTTGALKTLGAEGKLTTDVLIKAFPAMSEQIDKDFGQITKTIGRAMVELKNAFEDVVADSNRATGATGSVANSISDLAKTVTENKEAISSLFQGLITAGGFVIGMIADVTRSIQGLAIVSASPSKSLGDWMTSNAEDMKRWQEEIANGTAFLKDRLFELSERRRELAITAGDAFNDDKVIDGAKKELAAIDLETLSIQSQILAFEGLAKAKGTAKDSFIVANDPGPGRSMASLSTVKDPWQVQREWSIANSKELYEIESKNYEAQKKRQEQAAQERITIEQKLTDAHAQATKSRYDYSVWALDQEVAKMREKAGTDKELQAQITQYRKDQFQQLGDFGQMYSSDEQSRLKEIKDSFMRNSEDIEEIEKEKYKNQQDALDKMTSAIKSNKQSEIEAYKEAVDEELKELERLSDGSMEYEEKLAAYREIKRRELNSRLLREEQRNLTEMQKLWRDFAEGTKSDFTDIFASGLKGEFDSIGEAWSALMDSMKSRFLDLIAELTMNSLFEAAGLGQISGGGATWGSLFNGGKSDSSGGGIIGGLVNNIDWSWITGGSSGTDFSGWEAYDYYADGGVIEGGSGRKDDVYLGRVNGKGIMAKGGEFIMPPEQTAKYYNILEAMRQGGPDVGFAAGGSTSGRRATGQSGVSGQTLAEALAALSAGSTMTAQSLGLLTRNIMLLESSGNQTAQTTATVAEAQESLSSASQQSVGKTKDLSDAVVGLGMNTAGAYGKSMGLGLAIGALGDAFGPLGVIMGLVGAQAISNTDAAKELGKAWGGLVDAVKGFVNDIEGEIMGLIGAASALGGFDAGYNDAGFANYGGDLYGESTDPGSYGDGGSSGFGNTDGGYGYGDPPDGFGGGFSDNDNDNDGGYGGYYADGGIHRGGWRMVGERGPELEYTPPSRIFSNTDTNSILNGLNGKGQAINLTIPVSVGNEPLTTLMVRIADNVATVRQRQNVQGRAYAR